MKKYFFHIINKDNGGFSGAISMPGENQEDAANKILKVKHPSGWGMYFNPKTDKLVFKKEIEDNE
jgi:hypothetical protein